MDSITLDITQKEVVIEIRRVYFEYFEGSYMSLIKFNWYSKINQNMIWEFFSSWDNALNQAQINLMPIADPKEEKQKMLADLNKIKAINQGKYFNYDFYKENSGQYYRKEILHLLNHINWEVLSNKELKLFRKNKPKKLIKKKLLYTKKQLYGEVKRIWKIFGRQPTYYEFRENTIIKMSVYEKEFLTWTSCIEEFCLKNINYSNPEIGRKFHTSKKLLLQEIKLIKKINPRIDLNFKDFKELGGKYTKESFNIHFGSWEDALNFYEVKFTQDFSRLPKDQLLFNELQKIIETLGRNPSAQEIENIGKYPYRYYINRFGGVKKCLSALAHSMINKKTELND